MLNFRDDPVSFTAFIREHQDKVFNLVLNRVQHWEDAEDITQDVFIAVFRKPEAFRGDSAISTWLYRIAIHKCIDHLRKRNRKNQWSFTALFGHKAGNEIKEPADFLHPGMVSENREKATLLFKALKQLPDKQYTAWILNEMEQLGYKEISEVMEVSLSSVESLLFRARQNLKKILAGMYPDH